jgi:hypothetical protein
MADVEASIQITADDQASPAVQRAADAFKGLQSAGGGATDALDGFNLSSALTVATGVSLANVASTVVSGIVDIGKEAIGAAAEMEGLRNRAEVLYQDDLPAMEAATAKLAGTMNRSSNEALALTTRFTALLTGVGEGKQSAEQMSLSLTQLAIDFGKVFNVSDEQAMMGIQGALEGNTRALRQYGIVMTTTTLQEFAHSEGITTKVSKMTEAEQVELRYQFLMAKTGDIQRAATKDTGGFNDSVKALGGAWNDLEVTLGRPTLPMLTAGLQLLTSVVKDVGLAVRDLYNGFKDLFTLIASESAKAAKALASIVPPSVGKAAGAAYNAFTQYATPSPNTTAMQQAEDASFGGFGGIPARASGGTVGEPYTLVGEQGPELVSLPAGSYVHTASQTQKMLQGVTVTIGQINVYDEADENRIVDTIVRKIQLQALGAS